MAIAQIQPNLLGVALSGSIATAITIGVSIIGLMGQVRTFRALSEARYRDLDERQKALTFWQDWLKAQQEMCVDEHQLAEAKSIARTNLLDLASYTKRDGHKARSRLISQKIFILERPRSWYGWALRLGFLALSTAFVLFLAASTPDFVRGNSGSEDLYHFVLICSGLSVALVPMAFADMLVTSSAKMRREIEDDDASELATTTVG